MVEVFKLKEAYRYHGDLEVKDILQFNWFKREKNKIEIVRENRSTSVFVEDLETHIRTEIDGWSMKY